MIKKLKTLSFFLLFIANACIAQSNFNLLTTIKVKPDYFTTDDQGNCYIVKGNELQKYNSTGKLLYKFSDKNLGNITTVDASNMLRIVVYYKNFRQVLFLDNTLSLKNESISLDKLGFQQTQLVCSSYNSSLWIYDQQNFELIRLNQQLEIVQRSGNLVSTLNTALEPNGLIENDNKIFLNNPSGGILVFDIYGTYYKTIAVSNLQQFEPLADWVYYIENKKAKAYNIKTTEQKEYAMPVESYINYRIENGFLFVQTEENILIYTEK